MAGVVAFRGAGSCQPALYRAMDAEELIGGEMTALAASTQRGWSGLSRTQDSNRTQDCDPRRFSCSGQR